MNEWKEKRVSKCGVLLFKWIANTCEIHGNAPECRMKHADKVCHRVIETVYECNKSKPQKQTISTNTQIYMCVKW